VTSLLGAIPKVEENRWDSSSDLTFEILRMKGKRIELVKIQTKHRKKAKGKDGSSSLLSMFGLLFFVFCVPFLISSITVEDINIGMQSVATFVVLLVISLGLLAFYAGLETAAVAASSSESMFLLSMEITAHRSLKSSSKNPTRCWELCLSEPT
jgi:CBS domain containing-hemolysin-like protein